MPRIIGVQTEKEGIGILDQLLELLFLCFEASSSLVPFIMALIISGHSCKKKGIVLGRRYYALVIVFALYVFGVFYVTSTGTLYDALYCQFYNTININLVPFSNDVDIKGYVLNLVLFVPFGILVPLIWKGIDSWPKMLSASFWSILLIEISQLCNYRVTDIDDMIMNMLGAMVGYLVCLAGKALFAKKSASRNSDMPRQSNSSKDDGSSLAPSYQLPLFIAVMFLGRFFLFNEMGLASLVYA